jgi:hypothetical protein
VAHLGTIDSLAELSPEALARFRLRLPALTPAVT